VENAFRLYCKTRPPAAAESVKRAKTLPKASYSFAAFLCCLILLKILTN